MVYNKKPVRLKFLGLGNCNFHVIFILFDKHDGKKSQFPRPKRLEIDYFKVLDRLVFSYTPFSLFYDSHYYYFTVCPLRRRIHV